MEFGGGGAGEAGSGSMHAQGHCTDRNKAKQGSIAEEHSQKLPVDCSQDFCLQVPCIVMEKGVSVLEWGRQRHSMAEVLQMLCAVTESLARVHSMSVTHRNIKPSNLLWLPGQQQWTLCDFGCSVTTGATTVIFSSCAAASVLPTRGLVYAHALASRCAHMQLSAYL